MITSNQLRAARALLHIDQRETAELADLSVPTIQRMEASDGVIRGNVDSLMKLVAALDNAGIELINPGTTSVTGGRGVRLKEHIANPTIIRGRQPKSTPSSRGAMAKARRVSDFNGRPPTLAMRTVELSKIEHDDEQTHCSQATGT